VLFLFVHRAFSRQENGWNHQKTIHGVKHLIVSGTLLAACVPTLGWARIQNAREIIHQETGLPLESIRVGYHEPELPPGAIVATRSAGGKINVKYKPLHRTIQVLSNETLLRRSTLR
jgi:hypothetical protein